MLNFGVINKKIHHLKNNADEIGTDNETSEVKRDSQSQVQESRKRRQPWKFVAI